jgi:hypothetical protein
VPIALYDLGYNLGVARRLIPRLGPTVDRLARDYAAISEAWNADQLRVLRLSADAAAEGAEAVDGLIAREGARVRAHDTALVERCDEGLRTLERAAGAALDRPVEAHARGHLIALALSVGLAACNTRALGTAVPNKDAAAVVDASVPSFFFPDVGTVEAPFIYDARITSDAGCATYAANRLVDGKSIEPPPMGTCPDGTAARSGTDLFRCTPSCLSPATLVFDGNGVLQAVESRSQPLVECLRALLGEACYPSLACTRTELTSHCWVA